MTTPDKCFVIMPFGTKGLRDGTDRTHDFDKVYRVLIRRAIQRAGLEPVRADEQTGAHIIHTDMFRELRDRAVVLADLSTENPNVFYELGIRHVLSPHGTVLICSEGSPLPFDIRLSRVIFYRYDGIHLDWEEVERVLPQLQAALEEARRGLPDSPVHALLENVFPERPGPSGVAHARARLAGEAGEDLEAYERMVATRLAADGDDWATLLERHGRTAFGTRALAHLCLARDVMPAEASQVAGHLFDFEQYDAACRLYERLDRQERLGTGDLLRYASAISERSPDLAGADEGLTLIRRALGTVLPRLEGEHVPNEDRREAFRCHHALTGMLLWRWLLTKAPEDLDATIEELEALEHFVRDVPPGDRGYPVGRVAQMHLRTLLMLRIRDGSRDRPDAERHRDAILQLRPDHRDGEAEVSYARWYKAMTLADMGDAEGMTHVVVDALVADGQLAKGGRHPDIGRRQYVLLRRFIEHHLQWWQNAHLLGRLSQRLQQGALATTRGA